MKPDALPENVKSAIATITGNDKFDTSALINGSLPRSQVGENLRLVIEGQVAGASEQGILGKTESALGLSDTANSAQMKAAAVVLGGAEGGKEFDLAQSAMKQRIEVLNATGQNTKNPEAIADLAVVKKFADAMQNAIVTAAHKPEAPLQTPNGQPASGISR